MLSVSMGERASEVIVILESDSQEIRTVIEVV